MKKTMIFAVGILLGTFGFCDEEQMKISLVKIVNQLEAIKPLITQAEGEQSQNPTMMIHFEDWTDSEGLHHGLRTDLNEMQQGLLEAINQESNDPRTLPSLQGDFVRGRHV
jgi:RAQPRD family integrative conjugative element protein